MAPVFKGMAVEGEGPGSSTGPHPSCFSRAAARLLFFNDLFNLAPLVNNEAGMGSIPCAPGKHIELSAFPA